MRAFIVIIILSFFGISNCAKCQIKDDSVKVHPVSYLKLLNEKKISNSNWLKSVAFISLSEHDSAIYFLTKALAASKISKDTILVSRIFTKLAWEYFQNGAYEQAINNYQSGYNYIANSNDCKTKLTFLHAEAVMHYYLKNYTEFESKLKVVYPMAIRCQDTTLLMKVLSSLSIHYLEQNSYDSALYYMNKKIKLLEKFQDLIEQAHGHAILGDIYLEGFRNKQEALKHYKQSLNFYSKIAPNNAPFVWLKLSNYYLLENKIDLAKFYAQKAFDLYSETKLKDGLLRALDHLAKINLAENNAQALDSNLRLIKTIQDSIYRNETAEQYAAQQAKFETKKNIAENKQLKAENDLRANQLNAKRTEQKVINISFALVLLIVVSAALLTLNRKKIAAQKRTIIEEKLRFKAVIEAEEKERVRIAKDLHDGLGQLLSTAKLNVASLEGNVNKEDEFLVKNASDLIDNAVKEVRNISHNMMPEALSKLGLVSAIRELSSKMNDTGLLSINFEAVNIDSRLDSSVEIALYRVVQEILNNIIKHAKAKEIQILLKRQDAQLSLQISDDGVGFNTNEIKESKGIGWKNVFSRISILNGIIDIKSSQQKGTKFLVLIPING